MSILERKSTLKIFAPAGLKEILDTLFRLSETVIKYQYDIIPLEDFEPGTVIFQTGKLEVKTVALNHRTFCRGFIFREINKRKKFDFFKAKTLGIPNEYFALLKQENDMTLPDGRKITATDLLGDADPELSFAYCSDTCYDESIIEHIKNVNVLYHEATFTEEMHQRAEDTFHSTAKSAATIALKAEVKRLVIGHFSARYRELLPILEEAIEIFPDTDLALEGNLFELRNYV